ncbi:sugar porter family MFS transporter [Cadophora sp. MPI-SDFR-AT-0126]|nr:sugar porter family MFS transporter [Leotiomycetes sp. MPI-SDFR-AT-0126]
MTIKDAITIYKPAIFWSAVFAGSVMMQSYAIALIPSFFGQDQFCKKYGVFNKVGEYEIPAKWKVFLVDGALFGEMFGLALSGILSERYGYRKTMVAAFLCTTGFVFIPFFASNIQILLVGQILGGVPWGMFQSLPSSFASDVMPQVLRAYLTTHVNLCWVLGQLFASAVLRVALLIHNEWAYRMPFALQWILPVILGALIVYSPESPVWLVRNGRREKAQISLLRLTTRGNESFDAANVIDLIEETDEREKSMSTGTSYWDCFRGVDFRRTRIACLAWEVQCLCGSVLQGYSPTVYKACGLSEEWAFNMSMIQYAIGIVGTFLSWWFMNLSGRRNLYLYGCMALFVLLISIGSTAFASSENKPAQWGMAIQYLLFTFVYGCTVGPVCFSLITEMSSMRLKTKTIVLARGTYNVGSILVNLLASYQLSDGAWGWGAKSGLFWAGTTLLCIIWIFFELPEPKGRTYCDMDVLFEHRIAARKFSKTNVAELASLPREISNKQSTGGNQNSGAENNGTELANMDREQASSRV